MKKLAIVALVGSFLFSITAPVFSTMALGSGDLMEIAAKVERKRPDLMNLEAIRCKRPSAYYLKEAERQYSHSGTFKDHDFGGSTAASLLYQICSQLERDGGGQSGGVNSRFYPGGMVAPEPRPPAVKENPYGPPYGANGIRY